MAGIKGMNNIPSIDDFKQCIGCRLWRPLDRIDSNSDYTRANVQMVCNLYNFGKGKHSEIDFIAMCCAVAERYKDNPAVVQRLAEVRRRQF